jgi:PAS domain S-box-containing protein
MGFESHELVGINGFEIIYPDDAGKMNDLMLELLHTKKPKEMVYRIKHKKGHWLTMQSICTPYIVDNEVAALINFSNRISG